MAGTLALVGSGEFLKSMRVVDELLLARAGRAAQARVVIIATASAPDGAQIVERWIELGCAHFAGLGAAVEAAPIVTRADADDPAMIARIAAANAEAGWRTRRHGVVERLSASRRYRRDVSDYVPHQSPVNPGTKVLGNDMGPNAGMVVEFACPMEQYPA